jgi:hypothetical protein
MNRVAQKTQSIRRANGLLRQFSTCPIEVGLFDMTVRRSRRCVVSKRTDKLMLACSKWFIGNKRARMGVCCCASAADNELRPASHAGIGTCTPFLMHWAELWLIVANSERVIGRAAVLYLAAL